MIYYIMEKVEMRKEERNEIVDNILAVVKMVREECNDFNLSFSVRAILVDQCSKILSLKVLED